MDITLKNRHVYVGMQLVSRFADRELPIKISYACGKSLVSLNEQFQLIESERKKIIRKHQEKDTDGVAMTRKSKDEVEREISVPVLDDDDAVAQELEILLDEEVELSVHSISLDVWSEHMEVKKCKECKRGPINVSSHELAALIRLGILVDDDD